MGASVDDRKEERIQMVIDRHVDTWSDPNGYINMPRDFTKEDWRRVAEGLEERTRCYEWFTPERPR